MTGVAIICVGLGLLVIGSVMMSAASEFRRCPFCGSIWNSLGSVIKYTGYAAKFRSQHLNEDPFPVRQCPDCQSKPK
jgi:hypothetical protein